MYNVKKPEEYIYVAVPNPYKPTFRVSVVGKTEEDLIYYLANHFQKDWIFGLSNRAFKWKYFDSYGRNIMPKSFYNRAYTLYMEVLRYDPPKDYYEIWKKNKKNKLYKGEFRRTPVEGIHKRRGGPYVRPRKIKHIAAMYANPEYKEFNRGSRDDYDDGLWDDWYRANERNWKSQRKHQWKEKKN